MNKSQFKDIWDIFNMCHPICKSDSLLCHEIGEVLGEAPVGLLLYPGTLRVEKNYGFI